MGAIVDGAGLRGLSREGCCGMPLRVAISFARAGEDSRRDGCILVTGGGGPDEGAMGGEVKAAEGSNSGESPCWASCTAFAMVCFERMIEASWRWCSSRSLSMRKASGSEVEGCALAYCSAAARCSVAATARRDFEVSVAALRACECAWLGSARVLDGGRVF